MSKLFSHPSRNDIWGRIFSGDVESSRFVLWAIISLVVLLLSWMSFAYVDQVIRVEGKIIPSGRGQQIQHLEGGIISAINVQEGMLVHKGDVLVVVDNTMAGASFGETKNNLEVQMAHAARLRAEVNGDSVISFSDTVQSKNVMRAENDLFQARQEKLMHEISIAQNMLSQRVAERQEALSRRQQLQSEMVTASERTKIVTNMSMNGAASKLELLDAKGREQGLQTDLSGVAAALPKIDAAIAEARNRIDETKSNFKAESQAELVKTLAEIERLRQVATADGDRMSRTDVRAPVDGTINALYVNTVGGVIKPGEVLLEITPVTKEILIEARALPKDRGYLHPNLDTEIRVSAYDPSEFGLVKGRVTKVGADSLKDSEGRSYYQVNITVAKLPERYNGKDMIPGMTVSADIVTGKRTILGHLLSPLRKFTYNMFRDPR